MSIKVDFHTHSEFSHDGGITSEQFRIALQSNKLDCIAITDHNRIDFAQKMQKELGKNSIIIGEEISTIQGEIIGLFLSSAVTPFQDIKDAVNDIKNQGGLVYIPHPFETVRSGIDINSLDEIRESVDIIESVNGRAFFQNFGSQAHSWAQEASVSVAASSDAHRGGSLGKTFTSIDEIPTANNLTTQLQKAKLSYARPKFFDIIAPKMNRIKHIFKGKQ